MVPHEITKTVYYFDELDDKAKEQAREWYRGTLDYEWWDDIYNDAMECLKFLGFGISNIYFSGFSSQGDGACFGGFWYARDVDVAKLIEHAPLEGKLISIGQGLAAIALKYPESSFKVTHRGQYCHSRSTDFEFDGDEPQEVDEELIELARGCMDWIYRSLEKEYEYLTSDEQVDDTIRANEYEFTKKGSRTW